MPYDLAILGTPGKRYLQVVNPEDGSIMYTSPTFSENKFLELHRTNQNFREWFDYAVAVSVQQRITYGMFRTKIQERVEISEAEVAQLGEEHINPETGEVTYGNVSDDMPDENYVDTGEQPVITTIN